MSDDDMDLIRGSGNVWQDVGDPDADIHQAKDSLAARIIGILDDRALSIRAAGRLTGFAAADFSRVRNANYGRFTLDRLIRMLHALDETVEVSVDVHPRKQPAVPTNAPRPCEAALHPARISRQSLAGRPRGIA